MSKSKAKGTWAESALREYFRECGWPEATRKTLSGSKDEGDLHIHPSLAIEVKNVAKPAIPTWMRETEAERVNAKAKYGILLVKPSAFGGTRIGLWHAIMFLDHFRGLMAECDPPLKYMPTEPIESWSSAAVGAWLDREEKVSAMNKDDIYRCVWRPRSYELLDDGKYFCGMHVKTLVRILYAAGYRPQPKAVNEHR